jgi:hypothetical protein
LGCGVGEVVGDGVNALIVFLLVPVLNQKYKWFANQRDDRYSSWESSRYQSKHMKGRWYSFRFDMKHFGLPVLKSAIGTYFGPWPFQILIVILIAVFLLRELFRLIGS